MGVAREEALDEPCHDEDGDGAHHNLHPAPCGTPEGHQARIGAGEEPPVAHGDARRSGNDDGGNLERPVQPDGKHRLAEHPVLGKEGLEAAHHHAVGEEQPPRANAGEQPRGKAEERHAHVVDGDGEEHRPLFAAAVDRHGVTLGNVAQRHVHIPVAEDGACEVFIAQLGDDAHEHTRQEDEEGIEQFAPRPVDRQRHLGVPEGEYAAPLLPLVAVQLVVERGRQVVQVEGDARAGVVGLRESQVRREVHIDIRQVVGRLRGGTLDHLLCPAPLLYILTYEDNFFHGFGFFWMM